MRILKGKIMSCLKCIEFKVLVKIDKINLIDGGEFLYTDLAYDNDIDKSRD